jgi:hypothetical protein
VPLPILDAYIASVCSKQHAMGRTHAHLHEEHANANPINDSVSCAFALVSDPEVLTIKCKYRVAQKLLLPFSQFGTTITVS